MQNNESHVVLKEGSLRKRVMPGIWKNKWFKLTHRSFDYYDSSTSTNPKGSFPVNDLYDIHWENQSNLFKVLFRINHLLSNGSKLQQVLQQGDYYALTLKASSSYIVCEWISALGFDSLVIGRKSSVSLGNHLELPSESTSTATTNTRTVGDEVVTNICQRSNTLEVAMQQWHDIVQYCRETNDAFVDPSFPPTDKSLYLMGNRGNTTWECHVCTRRNEGQSAVCDTCSTPSIRVLSWSRCTEKRSGDWCVFRETPFPDDIQQGALGDCWLLSSLAVLAERPDLLKSLVPTEFNAAGVYIVKLCKDGIWQYIIIDDLLPSTKSEEIAYSKSSRNQLWVPLIEKAMAKLYGSYEALSNGHISDGLSILTGAPLETVIVQRDESVTTSFEYEGNEMDRDMLWIKLLSFREAGYLMGASCGSNSDSQPFENVHNHQAMGLQVHHAYSVLDIQSIDGNRLLLLRNPWGCGEWKGDWSADSPLWTKKLRTQLGAYHRDNGIFWISFDDFCKYFGKIDICKLRKSWQELRMTGTFPRWDCENFDGFRLSCFVSTQVEITIQQTTHRSSDNAFVDMGLCILKVESNGEYSLVSDCRRILFSMARVEAFLVEQEEYWIVPIGFNKMVEASESAKFTIAVHSSMPVLLSESCVNAKLMATTLALRTRKHGECKEIFKGMFAWSQSHDSGAVLIVENLNSYYNFIVECDSTESFNCCSTRDSMVTKDSIPPMHWQIIQVFFQVTDSGYSWVSESHYNNTRTTNTQLDEVHIPTIRNNLHCPQLIDSTN